MTRLYKLPFALDARVILNLLQNAVPDAFQSLQQVVQLDSYLTVAHQFQQASGREFSIADLLDKSISLHGICGRQLYLSLEGGADLKQIWQAPVARLLREQYPRFFSRDFLLLTAVLYCKDVQNFRLDMLVSPLSHLIASLFFWEKRVLPQLLRQLLVGSNESVNKEVLSTELQLLFALKSFLIEQKQSLSFLLASDQSPAQLLRMAEEPSGIFSSKLYQDSKKLILALRKEQSSIEEQLGGFEEQNFVVAAVDSRDLSLKRLQSRVEAIITILQTLQFIIEEQAKVNKRGFLTLLKISDHQLSQYLVLHRFSQYENQILFNFVNSLKSNLILRQLLLSALQRGYPDRPLMLCERLGVNKNPLLAQTALSLCEESKMQKAIQTLKIIDLQSKEKSDITLKILKYLLALDLHSLKQNLPLEELSTLVPQRIWRLKVTRDRQTLSMKLKRSAYIGVLVELFEDLKNKDLLSDDETSFLADTKVYLEGRSKLNID